MKVKNANNFSLIFGAIFFAVGLSFLLAGVIHCLSFNAFKNRAVLIDAQITRIIVNYVTRTDTGKRSDCDVWVSYTIDGKEYETKLNYYTSGMREGDTVEIFVDPDDPADIETDTLILDIVFIGLGGVFTIIGGCFLVSHVSRLSRRKRLLREGEQLAATITNIRQSNVLVNGRHPYRAECEYTDQFSGEKYLFSSDSVMSDISGLVGSTVTVYADRSDRRKYYVDIGGLSERYTEENKIHDYR